MGGSQWNHLKAQSAGIPLLERSITISLERETLESALKKISQQGGFTFSYNPAVVKADRVVTHNFVDKTVREILDELFNGIILYKERGNYIILNRAEESSSSKDKQQITGYVIDEATGSRLKNVSIYDPVSLASAVTDDYGYFQIDLPESAKDEVKLAVRKQNYTDTVVVASGIRRLMNIRIKTDRFNVFADSVGSKMKRFWRSTKNATILAVNMENIDDTLYRSFQFSFIPFVGTNHKLSGHVVNDYSLNMFGGYSLGVEKFELGGFFNTVRGDVHGVQVAGFVNGVGGNVKGVQLAGFVNATRGTVKGAQLAGFVNATRDTVEGLQMAGAINFNWNGSKTVGLAGLMNFNLKDSRGVKLAGASNMTIGKQEGPHIAGLFNFSGSGARTASVAGVMNFTAGDLNGVQVAGVLNFAAGDVTGAQVGVLNYGRRVNGAQVGILNIADSVKGVPIGVLSIVGKGYHTLELSADEIFYTNLAFRTGVRQFYNIITAGVKPASFSEDETYWTFGYGIGTAPKLTRWLYLNFDLTANQVLKGKIDEINMLNKLYLGVEFRTKRKFALTLGATLNGYVTDTTYGEYPDLFTDYTPHITYDRTYSNDINLKMWWGGKIGIRFL
jgi:hypothetical protein